MIDPPVPVPVQTTIGKDAAGPLDPVQTTIDEDAAGPLDPVQTTIDEDAAGPLDPVQTTIDEDAAGPVESIDPTGRPPTWIRRAWVRSSASKVADRHRRTLDARHDTGHGERRAA